MFLMAKTSIFNPRAASRSSNQISFCSNAMVLPHIIENRAEKMNIKVVGLPWKIIYFITAKLKNLFSCRKWHSNLLPFCSLFAFFLWLWTPASIGIDVSQVLLSRTSVVSGRDVHRRTNQQLRLRPRPPAQPQLHRPRKNVSAYFKANNKCEDSSFYAINNLGIEISPENCSFFINHLF